MEVFFGKKCISLIKNDFIHKIKISNFDNFFDNLSKFIIFVAQYYKMDVQILEVKIGGMIDALIERASSKDMPLKKDKWQFNWRSLYKTEGAEFYKLTLKETPFTVEGVVMFTLMNEEMLYMNNIEIAPHNFGSNGKYDHVAGCLIAFGCKYSVSSGKNHYEGYLTFDNKTKLVPLYRNKYGAIQAMGLRMFIEPEIGVLLIRKYLNQ